MNRMFKLGLGLSAAAVLAVGCTSPDSTTNSTNSSENATSNTAKTVDLDQDIANRAAEGDLATYGGARRLTGDQTQFMQDAISQTGAKNVILLIGDGMGDSEITVARNYAEGAGGFFKGIDALPVTGQYTHYSLDKDGKPNYVTDSAASGTAWATGTKSYNGAISVDIHGEAHETLLEKAKKAGKATGNVSTAEIEDATPAVQAAHVAARKCYGPEDAEKCGDDLKANGGKGSISEQIVDTRADITLGGGSKAFNQKTPEGKTVLDLAKEQSYQLPTTAAELDKITEANQDKPVLGLFSEGNMPVRWEGPKAEKYGYLQEAATCTDNPERTADIPTLAAMTEKAIDVLKDDEDGFFLQVEGASIDKQDHNANPCGQIGETVDLDEAVQKALEFAKTDGETLVIVTVDHSHTSQVIGTKNNKDIQELAEDNDITFEEARDIVYPGLSRNLTTKDGATMSVGYATSENSDIESQGHTGAQLRIAAFGPGAANVAGLTDQTDLHFTIAEALGLE
ncbi:MAG: alkaline phosphatase [Corynebacterium glucuronolyticum]|nr:alkaline phosphatase [Mycobacteriaceae bacterium]MDY5834390.1 alkaline phosphatase [Corynebacterium glucuronolyticum]